MQTGGRLCNKKQCSQQAVDIISESYVLKQCCGDSKHNVEYLPGLSIDLVPSNTGHFMSYYRINVAPDCQ